MTARKPTSVRMPADLRQAVKSEAHATAQSQQAVLLSSIRAGLASLHGQRRETIKLPQSLAKPIAAIRRQNRKVK